MVILTLGDRNQDLAEAVRSARALDVPLEVIIVWNGAPVPADSPADVDVALPENLGIPAGRDIGAESARGRLILFLDDDAALRSPGPMIAAVDRMLTEPHLDVLALRIVDERGVSARRHVPRLRGAGPERPGFVAGFLGGACVVRRERFLEVGGYLPDFFYAMEETDLALRLVDSGSAIWYAADVRIEHPHSEPSRHAESTYRTARNRVWLAHRCLPAIVGVVYVADWCLLAALRDPSSARAYGRGTVAGWRERPGPRRPIKWRTVWRLARLGRPPVL